MSDSAIRTKTPAGKVEKKSSNQKKAPKSQQPITGSQGQGASNLQHISADREEENKAWLEEATSLVDKFVVDQSQSECAFPASLNSHQRMIVHEVTLFTVGRTCFSVIIFGVVNLAIESAICTEITFPCTLCAAG